MRDGKVYRCQIRRRFSWGPWSAFLARSFSGDDGGTLRWLGKWVTDDERNRCYLRWWGPVWAYLQPNQRVNRLQTIGQTLIEHQTLKSCSIFKRPHELILDIQTVWPYYVRKSNAHLGVPMAPNSKNRLDRARLRDFLSGWYDKQMSTALRKPRSPADVLKKGGDVFDIQPEMASTKAVRVLLEVKDILGFEPSKEVIKKGGYASKADFVDALTARIEEACKKEQPIKSARIPESQRKEADGHAQI